MEVVSWVATELEAAVSVEPPVPFEPASADASERPGIVVAAIAANRPTAANAPAAVPTVSRRSRRSAVSLDSGVVTCRVASGMPIRSHGALHLTWEGPENPL